MFREFGEDRLAKEFAKAIVRYREEQKQTFERTQQLRECIERVSSKWKPKKTNGGAHPATRCFQVSLLLLDSFPGHVWTLSSSGFVQALRIEVNKELDHVDVRLCWVQ